MILVNDYQPGLETAELQEEQQGVGRLVGEEMT